MKKKKSKKGIIDYILTLVSIVLAGVMLFSGYKVFSAISEYIAGKKEYDSIREEMILPKNDGKKNDVNTGEAQEDDGYLRFDYDGLMRVNSDFKCWIEIPGTVISYPVVQSSNNDYYLRRTFTGQYNVGGVIFIDYTSPGDLTGQNTVIYGHRMNDGSMFTDIKKFLNPSFSMENNEIRLYRSDGIFIYKVFAAFRTDAFSDCYKTSFYGDTFAAWIAEQIARSSIDFEIVPTAEDKIITLSTCVGSWDEYGRHVVMAVLTDIVQFDD